MSEIKIKHQEILEDLNQLKSNIEYFENQADKYSKYIDIFNDMISDKFIPTVLDSLIEINDRLEEKSIVEIKQIIKSLEEAVTAVKELDEAIRNEVKNEGV